MNSGRGKEKWKHVRTWLEAFEKFLPCVTNAYCVLESSKGKCLLGGWWDSRKLLLEEQRRREGEVAAQCFSQLDKSVEALLSSNRCAEAAGVTQYFFMHWFTRSPQPFARVHYGTLSMLKLLYICCQHAMEFVIEYDLLWHWKFACPSQKTSTCFRKDKCASKNLLIKYICSRNKKAFLDFINSKTMSTLCQANHGTAHWGLWYVCNGEW